jgi:hypothetical protein
MPHVAAAASGHHNTPQLEGYSSATVMAEPRITAVEMHAKRRTTMDRAHPRQAGRDQVVMISAERHVVLLATVDAAQSSVAMTTAPKSTRTR